MNEAEPHPAELQLRKRAKQALRKQLRTVRAALPKSACEARSAKTMERLLGLEELRSATVVLAFASIGNEVSTTAFIDACLKGGKRVGLPRVVGDDLALHEIASGTELAPGAFSVPEPPETSRILSDDEIDFALIPALSVRDNLALAWPGTPWRLGRRGRSQLPMSTDRRSKERRSPNGMLTIRNPCS